MFMNSWFFLSPFFPQIFFLNFSSLFHVNFFGLWILRTLRIPFNMHTTRLKKWWRLALKFDSDLLEIRNSTSILSNKLIWVLTFPSKTITADDDVNVFFFGGLQEKTVLRFINVWNWPKHEHEMKILPLCVCVPFYAFVQLIALWDINFRFNSLSLALLASCW